MVANVLFIGPYRQGLDGWNIAAREYIRALIKTGCNLTIRPIYMGIGVSEPPVEFLEYEENILPHYDIVIQNVLPHLLEYNSKFGKNVALIYTETRNWQNVWASRLSMMDEIWVPSKADVNNLTGSGVLKTPILNIPIPTDVSKFERSYTSDLLKSLNTDSFKFYFIGELIQRKCLDKLLQAFHIEFDSSENVDLVIKTSIGGLDGNQVASKLNEYVTRIKSILRVYSDPDKYKQELCITSKLDLNDLHYLHSKCNCFVMPSMGESWSMPVMDAMGFGKTPIIIGETGPNDIINNTTGWVVPSRLDNVIVTDPPLPDLYTAKELWHNYSVSDLAAYMRIAYEDNNSRETKEEKCCANIYNYTYDKIANQLKGLL